MLKNSFKIAFRNLTKNKIHFFFNIAGLSAGMAVTLLIGPVAWLAMNKWLQDFAYRITINWSVFIMAAIAASSIALLTISFQTIKAPVANLVKSLRTE